MEGFVFLALLAYPIFGALQVIDGIRLYFQKNRNPEYYHKIGRYLKMVVLYFTVLGVLCVYANSLGPNGYTFQGFMVIYLFIVPLPLAIYKRYITKRIKREKAKLTLAKPPKETKV